MVRWTRTRVYTGNHYNFGISLTHEGVSQNHRQFRSSKWDMIRLGVKSANALLQGQKTLVDFCSFKTTLSVITLTISCSFRACQIHKEQLSTISAVDSYSQLTDSMGPTRSIVGSSLVRSSYTCTIVYNLLYITGRKSLFFFEAKYLDFIVSIFKDL